MSLQIIWFDEIKFLCTDYRSVKIPSKAIIYCDIPYEDTTGYNGTGTFNNEEFWEYARFLSKEHIVFISEQKAPNDFVSIWQKSLRRQLDNNNQNTFIRNEHLFILSKLKNMINI